MAYEIKNDSWNKLTKIYFLKYFSEFFIKENHFVIWINERIVQKKPNQKKKTKMKYLQQSEWYGFWWEFSVTYLLVSLHSTWQVT